MKRTIALITALILIILCCGCGDKNEDNSKKTSSNSSVQSEDTGDNKAEDEDSEDTDSEESEADGDTDEDTYEEYQDDNTDKGTTTSKKTGKSSKKEVVSLGDAGISKEEISLYDSFNPSDLSLVEYNTFGSTLKSAWNKCGIIKSSKSDAAATKLRNKILNAKNTAENYKITGKTYYVSPNGDDNNDGLTEKTPFKTMDSAAFSKQVKPGDAVLFERGGVWRLTNSMKCNDGVIYGAYGKGDKPTICMSTYNYADKRFWRASTRANIWKVTVADSDIGIVVFDHGELVGYKKTTGIIALEKNGDYYYNKNQDVLYLYYDGGNPGEHFKDIEIGLNKSIITVTGGSNVVIDNLRVKYGGKHGISMGGSNNNTKITNCELGFIGGASQTDTIRWGNAIQQWNGTNKQLVQNNWIYQIYDTGITWQGDYSGSTEKFPTNDTYKDITYKDNLIEYCCLSVEFWHEVTDTANKTTSAPVENFVCTNNISRFAGYGFGIQRPDHSGYHIIVYDRAFKNAKGCVISDNIFDLSYSYMVRWNFVRVSDNGDWTIKNNTWYQRKAKNGEGVWYGSLTNATNQSTLESAVSIFDKNPKLVEWIKSEDD